MSTAVTIDPKIVKELRDRTNAGMMDCKKALTEANGNSEEAEKILRKKFNLSAGKKAGRETREGVIASYIHLGGKVGVLVEINCETDFVAKNEIFRELVKDITLQIAAGHPHAVSREQVAPEIVAKEREIAAQSDRLKGKPAQAMEKILAGVLDKFFQTYCLVDQGFVKRNSEISVKDHVAEVGKQLGDEIVIRKFVRFQVGEASA